MRGRRLRSLAPSDGRWTEDLRHYRFPDGRPIELFGCLAAHEGNALGDLKAATRACLTSALPVRFRELVVLRVCAALGCWSEWDTHVELFAAEAGLAETELSALADATTPGSAFDIEDRPAVQLVDDLLGSGTVAATTWDAVTERLTIAQALDSVMVAGQYLKVAWMANCIGLNANRSGPTAAQEEPERVRT